MFKKISHRTVTRKWLIVITPLNKIHNASSIVTNPLGKKPALYLRASAM